MTYRYRPSVTSFLGSIAFALLPASLVAVVYVLRGPDFGTILWILSGLMCLYSAFLCIQAVFVHLQSLVMNDRGFGIIGSLSRSWVDWDQVNEATLRERHNPVTRTDRLIVLETRRGPIAFPLSVLDRRAEQDAIAHIRAHTKLVVVRDQPAI